MIFCNTRVYCMCTFYFDLRNIIIFFYFKERYNYAIIRLLFSSRLVFMMWCFNKTNMIFTANILSWKKEKKNRF